MPILIDKACLSLYAYGMENINRNIGKNISKLRKNAHLTQAEFAEKLNYSDKSVSKWENGESLPGIEVLYNIAKFFDVSLDELVSENADIVESKRASKKIAAQKRLIITLLAISLVWAIATISYVCIRMATDLHPWIIFIWSVPASFIVALVFNSVWGRARLNFLILSFLNWTIIAAFYLQFITNNLYPLFFLGIPGQVAIILWANLNPKKRSEKKSDDSEKK